MSGEKLLSMIREIPTIAVSAKTDADSKANLLLGGAVESGKEYVESVWGIGFRWKLGFDGENANE